jgi:hypothetical protein
MILRDKDQERKHLQVDALLAKFRTPDIGIGFFGFAKISGQQTSEKSERHRELFPPETSTFV